MNNCVILFLIHIDTGSEGGVFEESLTTLLPLIPTSEECSQNVAHSCHIILSEDPSFVSEVNSITWFSNSVALSVI